MKKRVLDGGAEVIVYAPPRGFDPLTATAEDLRRHGFPPYPEDAFLRERYRRIWGGLAGKFRYIEPVLRVDRETIFGPRRPSQARQSQLSVKTLSDNYSGAELTTDDQHPFHTINADFVVPNVAAPVPGGECAAAFWIGIDDWAANDVFQTGVACNLNSAGPGLPLVREVKAWVEWYPAFPIFFDNFPVEPGDRLMVILCAAIPSGGGQPTSGSVYLANRTNGASTSLTISAPPGVSLVGNSAEWIAEVPTKNSRQQELADYGEIFFSDCWAVNTRGTIFGGTGDTIDMGTPAQVISASTVISAAVIQCEYIGQEPLP